MSKTPYRFWSRDQLYSHLLTQSLSFGFDEYFIEEVRGMVYDEKWNPMEDFNGCSVVQDHYHPFLPCFIHDYRWVVDKGGAWTDREFKVNLIKCGVSKARATIYFAVVRSAWVLFYQWRKKLKN